MSTGQVSDALVREVLGGDYLPLRLVRYQLKEELKRDGQCLVEATLEVGSPPEVLLVEGQGVGPVAALSQALLAHFSRDYGSLLSIHVTGFALKGRMETAKDRGMDALAEAEAELTNSEGRAFRFTASGPSIAGAALCALLSGIEFFLNSERAFVSVHTALLDARARSRGDLVQRFTHTLAELVSITSYAEVIQRIREAEALALSRPRR